MDIQEINFVVIDLGRNAERPLSAVELLEDVGRWIASECDSNANKAFPYQPFLVRDIIFDLYTGKAKIYYELQPSI